jgi:hypothetical protein
MAKILPSGFDAQIQRRHWFAHSTMLGDEILQSVAIARHIFSKGPSV